MTSIFCSLILMVCIFPGSLVAAASADHNPEDISGPAPQWEVGQAVNYVKTLITPGKADVVTRFRFAIVKRESTGQFWFEVNESDLSGAIIYSKSSLVTPTAQSTLLASVAIDGLMPTRASRVFQQRQQSNSVELDPAMFASDPPPGLGAAQSLYKSFRVAYSGALTTTAGTFQANTYVFLPVSALSSSPEKNSATAATLTLSPQIPVRGLLRSYFPILPSSATDVTKTVLFEIESIESKASTRITGTPFKIKPFALPKR